MTARIVIYSRSGHCRIVAQSLAQQTGAEISEVMCPRYDGPLGWVRAQIDTLRGVTPDITVTPEIGGAKLLIVGAPIWRGRLAGPMRRFLSERDRLPPLAGVFVTRARVGSTAYLEPDLEPLDDAPAPELLSLRSGDVAGPTVEGRIGSFLERMKPLLSRAAIPAFIPTEITL